jgi:hypothetical protein
LIDAAADPVVQNPPLFECTERRINQTNHKMLCKSGKKSNFKEHTSPGSGVGFSGSSARFENIPEQKLNNKYRWKFYTLNELFNKPFGPRPSGISDTGGVELLDSTLGLSTTYVVSTLGISSE